MAQFDEAKVGDKVWSIIDGWGGITDIAFLQRFPIKVEFKSQADCFNKDGFAGKADLNPTLFWDEKKIDLERPRKHECNFNFRSQHGQWMICRCGARVKAKIKCKACELIGYAKWRDEVIKEYTAMDYTRDKFLLNQHHAPDCPQR